MLNAGSEGGRWSFQDPLVLIDFGWCVDDENNIDRDVCPPQYLPMGETGGGSHFRSLLWVVIGSVVFGNPGIPLSFVMTNGCMLGVQNRVLGLVAGVGFHSVSTAATAASSAWALIVSGKAWSGMTHKVLSLGPTV